MNKKTMKLWQMIVLCVLLVGLLVTAFIPAFRLNGDMFGAVMKEVEKSVKLDEMGMLGEIAGEGLEAATNEAKKEFDEIMKDYDKEFGTSIYTISPFEIMTKSLPKLIMGAEGAKEYEKEMAELKEEAGDDIQTTMGISILEKVISKYNLFRVILWCVYGLALVSLVLVILAFALKWSNFVTGLINTIFGLAVTIIFIVLRFFLMGMITGALGGDILDELVNALLMEAGLFDLDMLEGAISIKSILSCLYSVSFLIAMIVGIFLLIAGVLTMIIGNKAQVGVVVADENWGGDDFIADGMGANGNKNGWEPQAIPNIPPIVEIPPVQNVTPVQPAAPAQPAMGQVKCTYGVATGQGFALPEDRKVIIGKSAQNANLVINNINISNVHCSIRYNAMRNTYIIKDHSTNGTFVNGVRLPKDTPVEYPAGTILSLADGTNQVTLG